MALRIIPDCLSTMNFSPMSRILRPHPVYWCGVRFSSLKDLFNERLTTAVKLKIEDKYRSKVNESLDSPGEKKDNFYVLSMFPYPSGSLHMGHVRVYTISDTLARYYAFNGKKVFQPMGWDAFGLPAENAAQENGVDPHEWTQANIASMRNQMESFGARFDWGAELATCDPRYYRWTQALFLDLFHAGLVYRKEASVNWDPVDHTVLADEQVDESGVSWRSGAKVEKRCLSQWFIRTTRLAKDLYEGLSDPVLQDWKDIINLQKHWIGEPNGVTFDFEVVPSDKDSNNKTTPGEQTLTVWLPEESIQDVVKSKGQYLVVKSSHTLAQSKKSSSCVLGHARNPFTRAPIPIVRSDTISYEPWRDVRLCSALDSSVDEVALAVSAGILNSDLSSEASMADIDTSVESWTREQICACALERRIGGYPVSSKLRDWLISRQRYWGTPIPIVHCPSCGPVPVPYSELPVTLPPSPPAPLALNQAWQEATCPQCGHVHARRETDTMDTFVDSSWYYVRYLDVNNTSDAVNVQKARQWLPVDLYIGGKEHAVLHLYYARFMGHFLYAQGRTPAPEPFKRMLVQGMIMGQTYREASTGKYLKPDEVYTKGDSKKPGETGVVVSALTGEPATVSWEKMSKSKYNGVTPAALIAAYGVDTARLLVLCDVAPTSEKHWSDAAFPGILNWQAKIWSLFQEYMKFSREGSAPLAETKSAEAKTNSAEAKTNSDEAKTNSSEAKTNSSEAETNLAEAKTNSAEAKTNSAEAKTNSSEAETNLAEAETKLIEARNTCVRNVNYAYHRNQQLNAAICRLQSYTATLRNVPPTLKASPRYSSYLQEFLIMLAPMAPHMASFLWDAAQFSGPGLWARAWPQVDNHCQLLFRCMIYKKAILDLRFTKADLVQLDKSSAVALLVDNLRTNRKLKNYQYLLEKRELSASNDQIQFSLDPNNDAILTLPISMRFTKPEDETSLESDNKEASDKNTSVAQR